MASKRTKYGISVNTANAYKHSGFYQYLYISKPEWYDLLDAAGNKLTLSPTWYVGSTAFLKDRIRDHGRANPTPSQMKRSKINQYMKNNNLISDTRYYFDIYVMIQTTYLFILAMHNYFDRKQETKYKTTLEGYIKHHMHNYFLLDGEPIINRFADIWGSNGIEYKKYSIEKVIPHYKPSKQAKERLNVLEQFNTSLEDKTIYTNAFTVYTEEEAIKRIERKYERYRKDIPVEQVTKHRLMF